MKRIKIITITLFGLVFFSCSNEESPKIEDNFLYKEVPIEPVNANYAVGTFYKSFLRSASNYISFFDV